MEDTATSGPSPILSQPTSVTDAIHATSNPPITPDPSTSLDYIQSDEDKESNGGRTPLKPKSLNPNFVHGEYRVRKLLPAHKLPPCLNPKYVNYKSVKELPRCWYGIPLLAENVLQLSVDLGLAVFMDFSDEDYCWGRSFYKLRDAFEEDTDGIRFDMVDAWGTGCDRVPLLGFFSNRDMPNVEAEDLGYIYGLLEMMKYPKGFTRRNLRWYPDVNETR